MTFSHPRGTRGGRPPHGRMVLLANKFAMSRIRRRSGKFMGADALILTTIGRKSGQPRSTPVDWFPGSDDSWIVVASAAGAATNPNWYLNLAAHPDRATIEMAGETIPVTARELEDPERAEQWEAVKAANPRFAQYEQKTDRQLPIIELTRRS
ncbi:nitroreductase/quinone reductase family protein [Prescottella agglutinans]|uniref:Deazaflavin-dependent oxidoreductase (Nitroreductase family) n=1 Tax=Prescottella agglutinans TaxID=1644129 RepID=A0ABT6M968_9NOCA|nr:nitroreductase/quinone reductase family protein [Prescottella agglutinans]MDH6280862.1 deazaflavin-dependent oxidoreductase (nitroreductase family) [Prescottella agglutinans]